ncbi:type II toxin-antitoxin system HicA family toxin, partial [Leptospira chreensis]
MTGKELIKVLKKDGWELDRITGSHHILKKKDKTL